MSSRILVYIIGIFFAVGGLDYLTGGRLGLGKTFVDTLQKMGMILLGVLGIYSLAPVAAQYVSAAVTPLGRALGVDPSIFPAMLFPIDMGGYQLALDCAADPLVGKASAILVSSICGATIGYTITVAVTVVDKKNFPLLARGILSGMVGVPVGCVAGALLCGVPVGAALRNSLPLCVLAGLLAWGLFKIPDAMTQGFTVFGRILSGIAVVGLILQALQLLLGVTILPGMAPLEEGLKLVATIIFIMTGAMCLLRVLSRLLARPLEGVARWMGINSESLMGMLSAAVSVTLTFTQMDRMDARGTILVCAFCATAAHAIGGQLGVVAELAPDMVVPFLVGKLVAGAAGLAVAMLLAGKERAALEAQS